MRAGVVHARDPGREHDRYRGRDEASGVRHKDADDRPGRLPCSELLPEVLRRPPDHKARDEDRYEDVEQHAVHAAADAAEEHLAYQDVPHRHHAGQGHPAVVHRVDRPVVDGGARDPPEHAVHHAEPRLLALHVRHDVVNDGVRLGLVVPGHREREHVEP